MTPFGCFIRKLRNENNVSQKELAAALGVSASYLSLVEKGKKRSLSDKVAQKIIQHFRLDENTICELYDALTASNNIISLPHNVKPAVYEVAHLFSQYASNLSNDDLKSLKHLLTKGRSAGE